MWIAHTEEVGLFQEVRVVEQALVQQIVATVKEAYLADVHNQISISIKDTVADELTHFQENYGQLMPPQASWTRIHHQEYDLQPPRYGSRIHKYYGNYCTI